MHARRVGLGAGGQRAARSTQRSPGAATCRCWLGLQPTAIMWPRCCAAGDDNMQDASDDETDKEPPARMHFR